LKDFDKLDLGSITVRFPVQWLKEIDTKCGPGKKYRDHSDAIRSYVLLARRVESLLEIQADPKKKQEFEEKFALLLKEKNIERHLETMDVDQLRGISFYINNLQEKKVQLLIDDIKTS